MKRVLWQFLAIMLASAHAFAGDAYPVRPISFVVPFAAHGDADQAGRNLAAHVGKYLPNARFLVDNQPGTSGVPATIGVLKAAPDGYTLLIGRGGNLAVAPALDSRTPYRPDDFTTLAILEIDPLICATRHDAPYKTVRDLIAAIRRQPSLLKYSTSGGATINNLSVQYLLAISGLDPEMALPIHFNGGTEAALALVEGRVDFACGSATSFLTHLQSGALRGLFTTAPGRMQELPDLPNAREAGVRDMSNMVGWTALMGPRGLPAEVNRRWHEALLKVADDPGWLEGNARLGGMPAIKSIIRPDQYVRGQYQLYERLVTAMGMRP